MSENPNSTSGLAEDLIRTIVQLGASEMHYKSLYEKTLAEMENGIVDVADPQELDVFLEMTSVYRDSIIEIADLRRKCMLHLFEMFDGDRDAWCNVKHLGIASETAFEAWQASDDDPALLDIATNINKAFIKAITQFLGMEITSCASCLNEHLRAKEEDKDVNEI